MPGCAPCTPWRRSSVPLLHPGIGQDERQEVLGTMYVYFDPDEML